MDDFLWIKNDEDVMDDFLWIKIDDGKTFEGTLEQFRNCFFNDADMNSIIKFCNENNYKLEFFTNESNTMTLQSIKKSLDDGTNYVIGVKFVKVGDEYRFLDIFGTHTDVVRDDELSLVDGAGTMSLYKDAYKVANTYSMTIEKKLKELGMNVAAARINERNYDFFEANFGEMKY